MSATPTPSSTLRTLVLVSTPADCAGAWAKIEAMASTAGGRAESIADRTIFAFVHALDALRFVLDLPLQAPGCRVAMHVGSLQRVAVDPEWVARGARAEQTYSSGFDVLQRLLAGCHAGQRLLSRPAAALLRRAAQGQAIVMPDGWDCQVGAGDAALPALSLDVPQQERKEGGRATLDSRQPLPSRPHWWLDRRLADAGPLQRALLCNHKSGVQALLHIADDTDGRVLLLAHRQALQCSAVACRSLELGDGQLDELPSFLVSELGGACLLADWLHGQPALDNNAVISLLQSLAEALAAIHAVGCAHGAVDVHAVARLPDGSLRLYGVRQVADPEQLVVLQARDCAAVARLLFGLLAGDAERQLSPFWQREIPSPAARRLIERCLDPGHQEPLRDMPAFIEALQGVIDGERTSSSNAALPARRWWQRRLSD
jgi:hypothetical protein